MTVLAIAVLALATSHLALLVLVASLRRRITETETTALQTAIALGHHRRAHVHQQARRAAPTN